MKKVLLLALLASVISRPIIGMTIFDPMTFQTPTSLSQACYQNDLKKAAVFILNGADVNAPEGDHGFSPLHWAALSIMGTDKESKMLISWLISKGAAINACAHDSITPLHIACTNNSLRTANNLITHGADATMQDKEGKSPLHYACDKGSKKLVLALIASRLKPAIHYDAIKLLWAGHLKNKQSPLSGLPKEIIKEISSYIPQEQSTIMRLKTLMNMKSNKDQNAYDLFKKRKLLFGKKYTTLLRILNPESWTPQNAQKNYTELCLLLKK